MSVEVSEILMGFAPKLHQGYYLEFYLVFFVKDIAFLVVGSLFFEKNLMSHQHAHTPVITEARTTHTGIVVTQQVCYFDCGRLHVQYVDNIFHLNTGH